MPTIIEANPRDAIRILYGQQSPETVEFFRQQAYEYANLVQGYNPQYAQAAINTFENIHGHEAMRKVRALKRQIGHLWQTDVIRPIVSIEDCCTAPPTMRRWLMAEPYIRRMYHGGQIDGYSQSYYDFHGKVSGEDHYDYRRVTEGLIEVDEDGYESYASYFDDVVEGDVLEIEEQVDIVTGWTFLVSSVKEGIDPTSRFGTRI